MPGQIVEVTALSGQEVTRDGVRKVNVDSALLIESENPLKVHYQAATTPHRARVTDELTLNWLQGPRKWSKGQLISTWKVQVHCNP